MFEMFQREIERDYLVVADILREEEEFKGEIGLPSEAGLRELLLHGRDIVPYHQSVLELLNKYEDYPTSTLPVTGETIDFVRASRRVCRIEREGDTESSGFLVGPDLVLTAAHAVADITTGSGFTDPANFRIQFDRFIWRRSQLAFEVSCGLVLSDHIVAVSPHLDYALLRLDRPVGSELWPFSRTHLRGWMDVSAAKIRAAEGDTVTVLQHPGGDLLHFSKGTVVRTSEARLHYTAGTIEGSSGAPVLNERKQVIGMHVAGDRFPSDGIDAGEGISFYAIFEDLQSKNVVLPPYP